MRVGEVSDGNGDGSRKAVVLPVDGGAAYRTEMKGDRVAALRCPHPRRSLATEGDLLSEEARLVADNGAGAALARQAVAHGDARWLALDRKVKLPAAAGDVSNGHGSAPWLLIRVECRRSIRTMHHGSQNRALYLLACVMPLKYRCRREGCLGLAKCTVASPNDRPEWPPSA
jgi:hypothetical protein